MSDRAHTVDEHPAARLYRHELNTVENELLAVIRHHLPRVGYQLTSHALVEVVGSVLGDILEALPESRADIEHRVDQLRLYLSRSSGKRAQ